MFDIFKKKSLNDQKIKEHCNNLVIRFNEYNKTVPSSYDFEKIFHDFADNLSFLSHLATGYPEMYSLLDEYVLLKIDTNTRIMPEAIWKEKTKHAQGISLQFKHEFDALLLKVEKGATEFSGICNECKKWYDADDPCFKDLIAKLNSLRIHI